MALIFNRAYVATSTTGTGTIALGAVVTGYATFAEAGVSDGDVVSYTIEDGNNFEVGVGTYAAAGPSLSRDDVTISRVSGEAVGTDKINLSGSAQVFITARAEDFAGRPVFGIGGATADATNKLSVNTPAVLFNRETDDIQVKLNKEAVGDTASFLFQTGFSGRAEIGTVGDDDFQFKVSSNGSDFVTGIRIAVADGTVSFPEGFADAAATRISLGVEIGADVQAYSANLDGWAAESPTDYSTTAEADALYQPLDSDLTAIAALATQAYGRGFLTYANEAAFKAGVNLEANTDFYAPGGADIPVADGGTGRSSHTAYAVLCGGTTGTAAQQSIAAVGTSGQVLTSNGAGALPTFEDAAGVVGAVTTLASGVATSGTAVDIDGFFTSAYSYYELRFSQARPSGDAQLSLQVLVASVVDSGTNYRYSGNTATTSPSAAAFGVGGSSEGGVARIELSHSATESSVAHGLSGTVCIYDPLNTTSHKDFTFAVQNRRDDGFRAADVGGGSYEGATSALSGIRLLWDGGESFQNIKWTLIGYPD